MTSLRTNTISTLYFLEDGGEMGERMRTLDWALTPLGQPHGWSSSLRNTVSLMLHSRFPMFLFWGRDATCLYNDAYRPSLSNDGKHPHILGQCGKEVWQEIWPVIGPWIKQIMDGGESIWRENLLLPIYRNGVLEDVYWTFNYSAVRGETGQPEGVLVICQETTQTVLANQDLKKTKEEFENVIEAVELGTFDIDITTQQLMCNQQMINWYGVPQGSKPTIENLIKGIANWDRDRIAAEVENVFASPTDELIIMTYSLANPKHPKPRYVHSRGKIKFNEEGKPVRFAGTVEDITNEISAQEAVAASRQQLEQAYEQIRLSKEAAALGTFDMDLLRGTLEWDTRCRELFGISHSGRVSYEKDFLTGLHPEDKDRIGKLIDNLFIKEISNGDYDVEYRTVGVEDGKVRWVRAKGKVFFNEENVAVRFIGSVLDISDLKKDEERKNTFVGMVSHELKTPLTIIMAYIQMLKDRQKPNSDKWEIRALEKAEAQLVRMRALVDGFLDLSRFETGKILLDKEIFDLPELIRELIDETRLTVTTHNIIVQNCSSMKVHADRVKIGNVVLNLVSNAIKYSEHGKPVNISCRQEKDSIVVSVCDEGIGLHPQDIQKLFARFYRVQNSRTTNISGFGIGLYLCAEIIERHGGKIWVESEVNKGSTFYFRLPTDED